MHRCAHRCAHAGGGDPCALLPRRPEPALRNATRGRPRHPAHRCGSADPPAPRRSPPRETQPGSRLDERSQNPGLLGSGCWGCSRSDPSQYSIYFRVGTILSILTPALLRAVHMNPADAVSTIAYAPRSAHTFPTPRDPEPRPPPSCVHPRSACWPRPPRRARR